jgi:hypothetical protein
MFEKGNNNRLTIEEQDSDVAGCRLDDRGLNLGEGRLYCLCHCAQTCSRGDPTSHTKVPADISWRLKVDGILNKQLTSIES